MTVTTVVKNAVRGVQHNSPILLTSLAVAGVGTTAVLAARGHVKAKDRLFNMRADLEYDWEEHGIEVKPFTRLEILRHTWMFYIPAVASGAIAIASCIGAQSINSRRQAALVGALAITEATYQEYKEQIIEAIGPTKEKNVRNKIVQRHVDENPPPEDFGLGGGDVLCLDEWTKRYFSSTMEKIRSAQNFVNANLIDGERFITVNEFYHYLGLDDAAAGEEVGFTAENRVNIDFSTALTKDGRPCLSISFRAFPREGYHTYR